VQLLDDAVHHDGDARLLWGDVDEDVFGHRRLAPESLNAKTQSSQTTPSRTAPRAIEGCWRLFAVFAPLR
jgi:hypothetical protein